MHGAPSRLEADAEGNTVFNYMRGSSAEWRRENNEIKLLLEVVTKYLELKEEEHLDKKTHAGHATLDYLSSSLSERSTMTLLMHAVKEGYESLCRKLVTLINAAAWESSLKKFETADGVLVGKEGEKEKEEDQNAPEKFRQARRSRHIKAISTTQSSWIEGSVSVKSNCRKVSILKVLTFSAMNDTKRNMPQNCVMRR